MAGNIARKRSSSESGSVTSHTVRFAAHHQERRFHPNKRIKPQAHQDDNSDSPTDEDSEDEQSLQAPPIARRRASMVANEEADQQEEKKEVVTYKKILALYGPNGANLAAAYYDRPARKLHVLEDTKDTPEWDLAVLVMEQYDPDLIIISTQIEGELLARIQEYCQEYQAVFQSQDKALFSSHTAIAELGETDLARHTYTHDHHPDRSSSESPMGSVIAENRRHEAYAYDHDGDNFGGMGKAKMSMVKMGSWINVTCRAALAVVGGLLGYLSAQRQADAVVRPVEVIAIESMKLDSHMLINQDALLSLSILQEEPAGSGRSDDKTSLYHLLQTAVTASGRHLLKTWLLRPLANLDDLQARHNMVHAFSSPENSQMSVRLLKLLKKIKNIPLHVKRIRRGRGGRREWIALVDAIRAANDIRDSLMCMPEAHKLDICLNLRDMPVERVSEFHDRAVTIIDFDESKREDRMSVKAGVDEDLDHLRQTFAGLHKVLDTARKVVRKRLGNRWDYDLNVVYFPQIGFLVAISEFQEIETPPHWVLKFSTDDVVYYTTDETSRLDEMYGDIAIYIESREGEIIQELVEDVQEIELEILQWMDANSELDCILALARVTSAFNLVRPKMVEEPVLEIRQGRHILQERWVDHYIRNDTMMCGGSDSDQHHSMMIVTGANGSGKSAYGKQVALIVYMAQIGCFVPAESATIGIVDKIYTRMQTRESVSKAASAFMIDLSQVSLALRGATPRSLIILDEFGKGTAPTDGAGLLAGVIEDLLNGPCPRTIVLTHFHELFTEQFVDDSLPILFCHMKTEIFEGSKNPTFFFSLEPGKSLTSFAGECALAHGIPAPIVERGHEVSALLARYELSRLWDAELDEQDIENLAQAEDLARQFLSWDIDEERTDIMDILKAMLEVEEEETSDNSGQDTQQDIKIVKHEQDRYTDNDTWEREQYANHQGHFDSEDEFPETPRPDMVPHRRVVMIKQEQ